MQTSDDAELQQTWKPPRPTPQSAFCLESSSLRTQSTAVFKRLLLDVNRRTEAHQHLEELIAQQSEPLPRKKKATSVVAVFQRLHSTRSYQSPPRTSESTAQQPSLSQDKTAALLARLQSDARRRGEERQHLQQERKTQAVDEALRLANLHHCRSQDRLVRSRLETVSRQTLPVQSPPKQPLYSPVQTQTRSSRPIFTRYASRVSQQRGLSSIQRLLAEAERAVLNLSPHNSRGQQDIDELLHQLQTPSQPVRVKSAFRPTRKSTGRERWNDCITHPPAVAPRLALQQARTMFGPLVTSFDQ